jgi:hypothetical protein
VEGGDSNMEELLCEKCNCETLPRVLRHKKPVRTIIDNGTADGGVAWLLPSGPRHERCYYHRKFHWYDNNNYMAMIFWHIGKKRIRK